MQSIYIKPGAQDSHSPRSRDNEHTSSVASHQSQRPDRQGSRGQQSEQTAPPPQSANAVFKLPSSVSASRRTSSLQSSAPAPAPGPSATPQHHPAYQRQPLASTSTWSYRAGSERQRSSTPLLQVQPAHPFLGSGSVYGQQHSDRTGSIPADMSAVGIQQYDARFDAGARPSYTWPTHFEMNEHFMSQQELSPHISPGALTNQYEEAKPLPLFARSLSDSPPKATLTPEQRELKRQRDVARRDSKAKIRRDRSPSNPYTLPSQKATPDLLPRTLPEYASSLAPSPVLSQGSHPVASPASYMSNFSPHPSEVQAHGQSEMYGPVFTMGSNEYNPISAYSIPFSGAPGEVLPSSYIPTARPQSLSALPDMPGLYASTHPPQPMSPQSNESRDSVRVVHSRPKPQCWEHGCNGRQFSTFSNLLRHQREKSGVATKSSCPSCGAEFTRTTARNGHMAHEKCKQRRNS